MYRTIRVFGLMLALASVFTTQGAAADDPQADTARKPPSQVQYTSEAHAALAAGNPRHALALLNSRTLRLSPVECCSVEGRAFFLLADYAQARRKLESALRLRPKHASDLYWLGRTYAASGMTALAASRFQEAHWNGLDTTDLHYHWAVALESLGELLGKISQRKWHENAGPPAEAGSFSLGMFVVGPVPAKTGWVIVSPPNSAIHQIHRVLEQQPKRGDALLLCGEIWAAVNRHKQAVSRFAQAARQLDGEQLTRCHESWAASLLALGDYDAYLKQVRTHMRESDEIDATKMAMCYERAAHGVAQRGDLKRQIRYLTLSVELQPDVERLITLADALLEAQRADDASRYLRTALEDKPTTSQRKRIMQGLQRAAYLASPR